MQCQRIRRSGVAVGLVALTMATMPSVQAAPGAHRYQIAATMVMPHLEEMRRLVVQHTRCVADDAPEALFPVMDQHALRGCRLDYPQPAAQADGTRRDYVLVCASARVASGTARIDESGDKLTGTLAVKMGGKNMTFSQRVEARRGAPCAPTD